MARPKLGQELNASATLGLRITASLRADLEAIAKANGRTLTEEARVALERHVATSNARKASKRRA